MSTFAELKNTADSPSQVRKIVEAVAFLAPASADAIETLTGPDGSITALPAAYKPVGLITKDGFSFSGDTNEEDVEALGYAAPVRSDITSVSREVSFTAYEVFRRELLEVAYGMDLSAVTQGTNGEIAFDRPALPQKTYYRLLVIGKDGAGTSEIFRAKFFPRVSISSIPEEAWGEDALTLEFAFKAFVDEAVGTSEREFIAGVGAKADKLELGFTQSV
ncbi:hypothetical protein ACFY5D_16665 [Paeniglutamicibacter sp. NPDC012692]|uniref:hypothetical protein n=1 Tax=Paeniglutamicibacter sp. NPDC012692 TaxID=3364388 RepID=UPI0036CDB31E